MATPETRQRPNVLITGSPGTGKSTLAEQVAEKLQFDHVDEEKLYTEWDEQYQSHVLDEDGLLDHIEGRMNSERGGAVVDYHGVDFFPERWFDFVIVLRYLPASFRDELRCNNTLLFDRLKARGYSDAKVRANIECEIFGSLLEEARESYKEEIVFERSSETVAEMNANVDFIVEKVQNWKK